ncbi:MAG: FAD-dependent oxidoreductase, partial [Thaumarchaeota archaeon]|nr:FAD-dependent oxidoreductase [Nitrososphaerota archaeon]
KQKNLPFKKDGVLEVALDEPGTKMLEKYMSWGEKNGLEKDDIILLDGEQVKKQEPEISCQNAIFCKKDASVDYGILTGYVMDDAKQNGATFLLNTRAEDILDKKDFLEIKTNHDDAIQTDFLINAAGGMSIDSAHKMNVRPDLTDIHFRGEYWQAGPEYQHLTKTSVYSVPK